VDIN
jgi:hypothetical protein